MSINLVRMCPHLRFRKCVVSGQQPCHSMHIENGVYPFLPAFEILGSEDLNPGDVWKGLCVGKKHLNWWCSSTGWDCDQ